MIGNSPEVSNFNRFFLPGRRWAFTRPHRVPRIRLGMAGSGEMEWSTFCCWLGLLVAFFCCAQWCMNRAILGASNKRSDEGERGHGTQGAQAMQWNPMKGLDGEKQPVATEETVEAQDFRKITNRFRGICGINLVLVRKKAERSQHGNRWKLKTLGKLPIALEESVE